MKSALWLVILLLPLPSEASRRSAAVEKEFTRVERLIEEGDYVGARDVLDELQVGLAADDPRQVRYYERTGAAWLREGDIPQARAAFISALKAAQRLKVSGDVVGRAYAGMGLCLRGENNDRYALRFFRRALGQKLDEGTRMFVDDQIRELEGAPPLPAR